MAGHNSFVEREPRLGTVPVGDAALVGPDLPISNGERGEPKKPRRNLVHHRRLDKPPICSSVVSTRPIVPRSRQRKVWIELDSTFKVRDGTIAIFRFECAEDETRKQIAPTQVLFVRCRVLR